MFQPSRLSLAVVLSMAGITHSSLASAQSETPVLEALSVTATRGATKTETPIMETPQSVSVIDNEDWQEKGARTVQRAANYTPGVSTNQVGASNRYDYLILRGFSDGSINNTYLDGLRVMSDGGSYSSFAIDPWFLERIEIVKGPTSVLYGQGSPGGIVALTSKRPEFEKQGEVRVTLLAYLQRDPEGGYHSGLPYEGTVVPRNGQTIDNTFFEGEPDYDLFRRDLTLVGYDLEHRINSAWRARQKVRYLESDVQLKQVYAYGWASATELNRYYSAGDEDLEAITIDNQVQAELATGAVDHTVLLGLDYQQRENDVVWPSGAFPPIDAFNPQYGAEPTALYPPVRNLREQKQLGLYLQDQLALRGWRLTLGGRQDWVDIRNTDRQSSAVAELDETQFSGRAGLLYLFDNGVAPYLSYSTSFSPSAYTDANGDLLEPSEGEQIETGLKYQPAGTRDQYTLSLFRINQENLATKLPQESFYRAIGEIQSQGVELEANSQLTESLNVQLGYAYTDVTFEQSKAYRQGNTASQVPKHQLTLWTGYRFRNGLLDGANAGLGVRYVADIYADDANTRQVPDYTLVDLALGYDLGKLGLPGVSTQLNVNNLLDKEYVASCYNSLEFCYFGAERNVTASVSYRF